MTAGIGGQFHFPILHSALQQIPPCQAMGFPQRFQIFRQQGADRGKILGIPAFCVHRQLGKEAVDLLHGFVIRQTGAKGWTLWL